MSKSTVSKLLKLLIDPCSDSLPLQFPKNEDELRQTYNSNYFAAFDNIERLTINQSNTLCSIITGTEIVKRKLFTDFDDCIFTLRNPVVLNGISNVVSRSDLVDRCIMIKLPFICEADRLSEKKMIKDYQNDLPIILGGIFNRISEMFRIYKEGSINNLPRLADFAEYGYYIAETFGKGKGQEFLGGYKELIKRQKRELVKDDFLYDILIKFIQRSDNNGIWIGNMRELYSEMEDMLDLISDNKWMIKSFPKSPQHLSRELNMYISPLKQNGIYVNITRDSNNKSEVHLADLNGQDINAKRKPILIME